MTGHIRFPFWVSASAWETLITRHTRTHMHTYLAIGQAPSHKADCPAAERSELIQVTSCGVFRIRRQGRGRNGSSARLVTGRGRDKVRSSRRRRGRPGPGNLIRMSTPCIVQLFRLGPRLPVPTSPRLALFLISNASQTCLKKSEDDQGQHRAAPVPRLCLCWQSYRLGPGGIIRETSAHHQLSVRWLKLVRIRTSTVRKIMACSGRDQEPSQERQFGDEYSEHLEVLRLPIGTKGDQGLGSWHLIP